MISLTLLMKRLSPGLRIIVTKKMEKEEWSLTLDKLLALFRQEFEATERVSLESPPASKQSNQRYLPASGAALLFRHHDTTCAYCQGKHLSANCKTVTSVAIRKDILKRNGRCFVCLKKNHISKECQPNNKCSKCGRRHHANLCVVQPQTPRLTKHKTSCNNNLKAHTCPHKNQNERMRKPVLNQPKVVTRTFLSNQTETKIISNNSSNLLQVKQCMSVCEHRSCCRQQRSTYTDKHGTPERSVNANLY